MRRIRVLVVDDSAVVRALIADAVTGSPELELAGTAPNGKVALDRLEALAPDVVTLDVEMPVLGGIETLRELRRRAPRLPVLMLSSHTERGALATLDALAAGASDFVAKPATSGPEEARRFMEVEVLPRLRALAGSARGELRPVATPVPAAPRARPRVAREVGLVCIGVSTGGPQALERVVPRLPRDLGVPTVIVQHMPPLFTRLLAERLAVLGPFPAREAVDGARLAPGQVWIAQGGRHLAVEGGAAGAVLRLDDGPPECSCKPAVDVLFRSAVRAYGSGVLAVVLTGMGQDGLAGARLIREAGGTVLAQDEATSVVWGMPGAVAKAGLAEEIVPLDEVAMAVASRVARARPPEARSAP